MPLLWFIVGRRISKRSQQDVTLYPEFWNSIALLGELDSGVEHRPQDAV